MLDWLLRYKRKPRDNEKFKPIAAYMREEIKVYDLLQDGLDNAIGIRRQGGRVEEEV